jgi:hypothetical protein
VALVWGLLDKKEEEEEGDVPAHNTEPSAWIGSLAAGRTSVKCKGRNGGLRQGHINALAGSATRKRRQRATRQSSLRRFCTREVLPAAVAEDPFWHGMASAIACFSRLILILRSS